MGRLLLNRAYGHPVTTRQVSTRFNARKCAMVGTAATGQAASPAVFSLTIAADRRSA